MPHLRDWPGVVWRWIRSAPLTYSWLLVLLVTTIVQRQAHGRQLHELLVQRSTNIHHLETDPLYVLSTSLFWIDGRYWTPYLVLFTVVLAPAERLFGQLRWLTVGVLSHVLATYVSEGVLYLAIRDGMAAGRLVHAQDVGVSYFLAGVAAALGYRIRRPWRWGYLGVLVLLVGAGFLGGIDFTAIGHAAAVVIGLCCYPLCRPTPSGSRRMGSST